MAVIYDRDNNSYTHVEVPFNYARGNPLPLDNTAVWTTKADAEDYAKNNPVAYVGQLLAVASTSESAVVYIIADTAGTLKEVGACKNEYDKLEKLVDYLYYIEFSENYDYDKCLAYFDKVKPTADEGACTSIRKDNLFGRNLDWTYNNKAKFVLRTKKTATRHASIGMAGNTNYLTDEIVKSRIYSPYYFVLPFVTTDGINDAGVCVSSHVVPSGDYGKTTGTIATGADLTLCNYMVPRYILDNFESAKEAVEYIRDHVNVYCAIKSTGGTDTEECAYFVADSMDTYLIEFINNSTRVIHLDGDEVSEADKLPTWEANFYRTDKDDPNDNIALEDDNTVSATWGHITSHGQGLERWNMVARNYSNITNAPQMMQMLRNLWYTKAYTKTTGTEEDPVWLSEFVEGSLTIDLIDAEPSAFNEVLASERAKFAVRSRDPSSTNFGTWETVHSAVYDMDKQSLWITFEQNPVESGLMFSLDDEDATRDHSHAFVECWDSISTSSEADAMHLIPMAKSVEGLGRAGYYCEATNRFLYHDGETWHLVDLSGAGTGGAYVGPKTAIDLIIQDFPSVEDITILHRSESTAETDRIITQRTNTEEGSLIYKGTCSSGIKEGSENYNVINVTDNGVTTTLKVSDGTLYKGVMILRVNCSGSPVPFWFDGTAWHELGGNLRYNLYNLKAMAYNTKATASYTPEGTVTTEDATPTASVTDPTFTGDQVTPTGSFTGTAGNVSATGTPTGEVSTPTFSGTQVTPNGAFAGSEGDVSVEGTPAGTVSAPTFTGTAVTPTAAFTGAEGDVSAEGTPAGTVSAPGVTVELGTGTFKNTTIELDTEAGELKITESSDITYANGNVTKAEATAPTFTGTKMTATGKFTPSGTVAVDAITPEGTVSAPTFTGTKLTSTGKFTPGGTVTIDPITPAGTVSKPEFTGSEMTLRGTFTPAGTVTIDPFTPSGTNSGTAVTISAHKHNAAFAGTAAEIISDPYTPEAE